MIVIASSMLGYDAVRVQLAAIPPRASNAEITRKAWRGEAPEGFVGFISSLEKPPCHPSLTLMGIKQLTAPRPRPDALLHSKCLAIFRNPSIPFCCGNIAEGSRPSPPSERFGNHK